jgi:uncharacterized protein
MTVQPMRPSEISRLISSSFLPHRDFRWSRSFAALLLLNEDPMHYLMFYEYTDDYLERRGEFRGAHLKHAWGAQERGELILGGAYADPADGAVLLFQCDSPEIPERFAAADPYVNNGLVRRYWIRAWTTVVGQDATTPVRLG